MNQTNKRIIFILLRCHLVCFNGLSRRLTCCRTVLNILLRPWHVMTNVRLWILQRARWSNDGCRISRTLAYGALLVSGRENTLGSCASKSPTVCHWEWYVPSLIRITLYRCWSLTTEFEIVEKDLSIHHTHLHLSTLFDSRMSVMIVVVHKSKSEHTHSR